MYSLSLGFLLGTLSIQLFSQIPAQQFEYLLIFAVLILIIFWKNIAIRLIFGIIIGFLYAVLIANNIVGQRIASEYEGKTLTVTGRVIDIPEKQHQNIRFYFDVDQAHLNGKVIPFQGKVKLGWYQNIPDQLQSGSYWQLQVRLKRPSGFVNTGGFDYEKWLFKQAVLATGYVRNSSTNRQLAKAEPWRLDRIRESIKQYIFTQVDHKEAAAVISALSVAVRNEITPEQWEIFKNTGTSHLIAISGLHIGMVAGFAFLPVSLIWMLFPRLYLYVPVKVAALFFGAILATLYALLAGFTIPTQRALIMVLFSVFALLNKRKIPLSSVLFSAIFFVLLIDPLAGLSEGFWLSFFSVSLIFYLLSQSYKTLPYQLLHLQLLLSFGMIPITAAFFGSASLVSPLANFIAIPWVTLLIVPSTLIAIPLFYIAPNLGQYPLNLAAWAVEKLFHYLSYLNELPYSIISFTEQPLLLTFAAILGVLILVLPRGVPGRWLGLIFIAPIFLYQPKKPEFGEFKLTVLDVGQGLATVLQTKHHTLIFDTGERYSSTFDIGKIVILPYLQAQNIHYIDKLILSHLDKDHAGGAKSIIDKLSVIQLLSSQTIKLNQHVASLCVAGKSWQWDGVSFQFLSPSPMQDNFDRNNYSCVLQVKNKYHRLLLLADIEKQAEKWLLKHQATELAADVMLVPHHGSKTSSTQAFLQAVNPQLAIISAGYRNRFHFPHQKIVQRYQELDITLLNTETAGEIDVMFPSNNKAIKVYAKRLENKHFWYR